MKFGMATMMAVLLVGGFSLSAQAGPAADGDSDGTPDVIDFCSANAAAPAPCGLDTDNDGYGNFCDGDLDNSGVVDGVDFNNPGGPVDSFLECFTSGTDPNGIGCDIDCSGVIDGVDFNAPGGIADSFLEFFTSGLIGPSGYACAGTVPCP